MLDRVPRQQQVIDLLAEHPQGLPSVQVAQHLGMSEQRASALLSEMFAYRRIDRDMPVKNRPATYKAKQGA